MTGKSTPNRKFQSPKGTRDFYPADMAVRRYIEKVWRETSINHGFEEVDGPTFEHLDLYTHKSGPGIVSEIFGVFSGKDEEELAKIRGGGDAPFALRPEFTPTLARMVAAQAAQLPKPIKWFAIPSMFRAERPQRGRLREHFQWNVDFIGEDTPSADAEVIDCAVTALEEFGFGPNDVRVKVSHREAVSEWLIFRGIQRADHDAVFRLIDAKDKMPEYELRAGLSHYGLEVHDLEVMATGVLEYIRAYERTAELPKGTPGVAVMRPLAPLWDALKARNLLKWVDFDLSIVRGLAYYTGTVFEIIAEGERAVAGGGRYDKLIESFGGPSLSACGFGMGDVVLELVLRSKGILQKKQVRREPDVWLIYENKEARDIHVPRLTATLRRKRMHVRRSYRQSTNPQKQLADAASRGARFAIIVMGGLTDDDVVVVRDLRKKRQAEVVVRSLELESRRRISLTKLIDTSLRETAPKHSEAPNGDGL